MSPRDARQRLIQRLFFAKSDLAEDLIDLAVPPTIFSTSDWTRTSHQAESLRNIPPGPSPNPRYFFWSGNGSPKSVVGNWQRSFRRLFKIANLRRDDGSLQRCHPHMLRDTFAVEMLLAGVPLEQVSILLGHKSVKITEKHYAPWVKARQEQLAANVRKAWNVLDTGNKTGRKSPKRVKSD